MATVYGLFKIKRHQAKVIRYFPPNDSVYLDSTNLPIIFINTEKSKIKKKNYITAKMTIVDNGNGNCNYADTVAFPSQNFDYSGYIALRYRGTTSFSMSDKKPYAIRSIDKPLEEGGVIKKSKLLGMRKGKKWALLAPYSDRSLIRDAMTYELAKNYMDFVPQTRFCEVVLNGVYMGVYILSEQITADRLMIGKPNRKGKDVTGGYLFEIDKRYKNINESEDRLPDSLVLKSPKDEELTQEQRKYVLSTWNSLNKTLSSGGREDWLRLIDELSFIDYMLCKEFAFDGDGYIVSTFLYKFNDRIDHHFKMCIWDFNIEIIIEQMHGIIKEFLYLGGHT